VTALALATDRHAAGARRNFAANAAALGVALPMPAAEWRLARDGALTAIVDGRWLAGCSVPRHAAERMLERSVVRGNVACLLLPAHGHQIDVCLRRVGNNCAVIALLPDAEALGFALACCDFSDAIRRRRLFFADDTVSLDDVFARHPGLPLPHQFLKLPTTDPARGDEIIGWAQQVFSKQAALHARRIAAAKRAKATRPRPCVAAGRTFRLWDDTGHALASAINCDVIDTDAPAESAVAYVAERAAEAVALVTVDAGRADSPETVGVEKPWLTWVTRRRVPAFVPAAPRDGLLLVDDALRPLAATAGWPSDRVALASWPTPSGASTTSAGDAPFAMIADVNDLRPTAEVEDFSSWRLVWDACRAELLAQPQASGDDPVAYLHRVRTRHDVPAESFSEALLLERLVAPAVIVGVARWLIREGVLLSLHGNGWGAFDDVATHWRGPVATRADLAAAVGGACALIDPFILRPAHPVAAQGRPVVRTIGHTATRVLQDLAAARAGRVQVPTAGPSLQDAVRSLLAR
jgi:hypothetical protein